MTPLTDTLIPGPRTEAEPPRLVPLRNAPKPEHADPSEVAAFARDLSTGQLQCRELGHLWKPFTAYYVPEQRTYERALRCSRCRTERWQTLSTTGAILGGHYVYPDGYLHAGLGRIVGEGRDALRLESLTRAVADPKMQKEA